jgi:hypothetical protein
MRTISSVGIGANSIHTRTSASALRLSSSEVFLTPSVLVMGQVVAREPSCKASRVREGLNLGCVSQKSNEVRCWPAPQTAASPISLLSGGFL